MSPSANVRSRNRRLVFDTSSSEPLWPRRNVIIASSVAAVLWPAVHVPYCRSAPPGFALLDLKYPAAISVARFVESKAFSLPVADALNV